MLRVALTGGIATGKSHALAAFGALGAPTIDADVVAREVVAPGSPALDAIVERFGRGVLQADGSLDRPALAAIVFADAEARRDLETIVHPAVYASIRQWLTTVAAAAAPPRAAIADIPLLFETGHEREFDRVIVVFCPPEQQLERLTRQRGLSRAQALQRLGAQMPIGEKVSHADFVIDTSGTFEDTDRQVQDVWERLAQM